MGKRRSRRDFSKVNLSSIVLLLSLSHFIGVPVSSLRQPLKFGYGTRISTHSGFQHAGFEPTERFKCGISECRRNGLKAHETHSDADDDLDPVVTNRLLSNQIAFKLSLKTDSVLEGLTEDKPLTATILMNWESNLEAISAELKQLNDRDTLKAVYASLIAKAAPLSLDPLQMSALQSMINSVADALLATVSPDSPITETVDEITQIHLDYIDQFRLVIDDGGSDGYSQSSRQEFLCYQFAGIVKKIYDRISKNLGSGFDMSSTAQDLRLNNWVLPVYARLQRRFVRFLSSNVEEKWEEISALAFERLLEKIKIEVSPAYLLSYSHPTTTTSSSSSSSSSPSSSSVISSTSSPIVASSSPIVASSSSTTSSNPTRNLYPPWELAFFLTKIIRNTVTFNEMSSIEAKMARKFQYVMSEKMRPLGRPLERITNQRVNVLSPKEEKQIEDMLNVGHTTAAGVYTIWHIRHNIVGVLNSEGKYIKDFLRPVSVASKETALEGIPKQMRNGIVFEVDELSARLKPSPTLEAFATLGNAVRQTAAEEFRAVITYNSDDNEWPESRDASFVAVASAVLAEALTSEYFDPRYFYENLVALAALEESIGVREPRAACAQSYEFALTKAALKLCVNKDSSNDNNNNNNDNPTIASVDFSARVKEVERGIGMILQMPEGGGPRCRVQAFKNCIDSIMATSEEKGESPIRAVDAVYLDIAKMLFIDQERAKAYVLPLGQAKFDKKIGSTLMNADIALTMPELKDVFKNQLSELASEAMMTIEQAQERVKLLAAAVLQSLLETALDENRKMNLERSEAILLKAYNMYRHPILEHASSSFIDVGCRMVVAKFGISKSMELVRFLEMIRTRLSDSGSIASVMDAKKGWGSEEGIGSKDAKYLDFLKMLQTQLITILSSADVKRGYS